MLKIVHLLMGAAALVLSILPGIKNPEWVYIQDTNAVALALLGLANLFIAGQSPARRGSRQVLQGLASLLLILALMLQALVLLGPLPTLAGQPALLVSLLLALVAALLHASLGVQVKLPRRLGTQGPLPGNREAGTVKWFNTSKGFGFISRDSGDDIFVHFRAIRGEGHRVLMEGQRVDFVVMQRDKGLQAEDVVPQGGR
jgi:CspA family cold shock protein